MNEFTKKIEERLLFLIKESEERVFYSDRVPLIQNQIISEFYIKGKQIEFKESINQLLYKYQNSSDNLGYGVIYYLFEICQDTKIPEIESTILEILETKTLKGKRYNNKDLEFFILQLLIDLPITNRTKVKLTNLIRLPEYKENLGYSLHCLELFSKINSEVGIITCLNNLVDLQIRENEIDMVFFRFADTLRFVEPSLVENWYHTHLKYPKLINGNLINLALLKFVNFARKKEMYFGKEWSSLFYLIECYSSIYSPQHRIFFKRATEILGFFSSKYNEFEENFISNLHTPLYKQFLNSAYIALNVINDESNFSFLIENFGNAIRIYGQPKTLAARVGGRPNMKESY